MLMQRVLRRKSLEEEVGPDSRVGCSDPIAWDFGITCSNHGHLKGWERYVTEHNQHFYFRRNDRRKAVGFGSAPPQADFWGRCKAEPSIS
jgi:hypothetical protein